MTAATHPHTFHLSEKNSFSAICILFFLLFLPLRIYSKRLARGNSMRIACRKVKNGLIALKYVRST